MAKSYRVFNNTNKPALTEWDRINAAITDSGGKKKLTTKDVNRFEELVPEHDSSRYTDDTIIKENGGKQHWKKLPDYKPICSYNPVWTMDDPGDKKGLYWPYIPNDDELMTEIYRDRKGARRMVQEHKKTTGHTITEESRKLYRRKEGF